MIPVLPRLGLALAVSLVALSALAQSNGSAPMPASVAKADVRTAFKASIAHTPASHIDLGPPDEAQIEAAREGNRQPGPKVLIIGVGRPVEDRSDARVAALPWIVLDERYVGRWEISSKGAVGLRIEFSSNNMPQGAEIRLAGSADPNRVYGPFGAEYFSPDRGTFLSPVVDGEAALIEVSVPTKVNVDAIDLRASRVSHLFIHPLEKVVTEIGRSDGCSPDLICQASSNPALANVGKSVAKMAIDFGGGWVGLCTGTLLNPTVASSVAYFYTAAHCISSEAEVDRVSTYWFFDAGTCGGGVNPAWVQRVGTAGEKTILHRNAASDVLLIELAGRAGPPPGAWFAGWDATPVPDGSALTGIHHPRGDLKKISLATMSEFSEPDAGYVRDGFIVTQWTLGVTEKGSSGSGIFSSVGSPATDYKLRGGLWGGASACGAPPASMFDFYSRIDLAYDSIREWIDPIPPPPNAIKITKAGAGTGTVVSSPAGINCGAICSAAFSPDSLVTLTATPTEGAAFGGWGGACTGSGSGPCVLTMNEAKSVRATFLPPGSGITLTASKVGTGSGTITSSQGGLSCGLTCSVEVDGGLVVNLYPEAAAGASFTGWSGDCVGVAPCTVTMDRARSVVASFSAGATSRMLSLSRGAIAFGGQSMGTTSPQSPIVVMNVGSSEVSFGAVSPSAQFGQTGNCVLIGSGRSCTLNATFAPAVTAIALGQTAPVTGQITIPSNATGSPHVVTLSGTAEKSLVTHFYRSILRRAPDAGGKAFWESEAQRLVGIGVSVNEAWYAMAMAFYGSAEYAAFNRGSAAYVTDLYNTFFNRTPDGAGLSYWNNEVATGLPRGVALAAFMFSAEFRNLSQGIFGTPAVRPEVDGVVDFYRGLLGRLPDSGGFAFWMGRFRAAQCLGQAAVVSEVEAISGAFANSGEYAARARSNADYVGDLYNAFLRRGGDLAGVQYWISQVTAPVQTRDQVRIQFKNSAEFQARVSAIVAATCIP